MIEEAGYILTRQVLIEKIYFFVTINYDIDNGDNYWWYHVESNKVYGNKFKVRECFDNIEASSYGLRRPYNMQDIYIVVSDDGVTIGNAIFKNHCIKQNY